MLIINRNNKVNDEYFIIHFGHNKNNIMIQK